MKDARTHFVACGGPAPSSPSLHKEASGSGMTIDLLGAVASNPFATEAPRHLARLSGSFGFSRLSGLSGLISLSGYLVSLVIQSANPMNETNQTNKINQFRPYGAGSPYSPSSPPNPYGRGLRIEGR